MMMMMVWALGRYTLVHELIWFIPQFLMSYAITCAVLCMRVLVENFGLACPGSDLLGNGIQGTWNKPWLIEPKSTKGWRQVNNKQISTSHLSQAQQARKRGNIHEKIEMVIDD
jgi:hypothetical protein